MPDSSTQISGEIDNAVRLQMRHDPTVQTRPRTWPRATCDMTREVGTLREGQERIRVALWFAVGGMMTVFGIYLVVA